jgi:hypothetical protein
MTDHESSNRDAGYISSTRKPHNSKTYEHNQSTSHSRVRGHSRKYSRSQSPSPVYSRSHARSRAHTHSYSSNSSISRSRSPLQHCGYKSTHNRRHIGSPTHSHARSHHHSRSRSRSRSRSYLNTHSPVRKSGSSNSRKSHQTLRYRKKSRSRSPRGVTYDSPVYLSHANTSSLTLTNSWDKGSSNAAGSAVPHATTERPDPQTTSSTKNANPQPLTSHQIQQREQLSASLFPAPPRENVAPISTSAEIQSPQSLTLLVDDAECLRQSQKKERLKNNLKRRPKGVAYSAKESESKRVALWHKQRQIRASMQKMHTLCHVPSVFICYSDSGFASVPIPPTMNIHVESENLAVELLNAYKELPQNSSQTIMESTNMGPVPKIRLTSALVNAMMIVEDAKVHNYPPLIAVRVLFKNIEKESFNNFCRRNSGMFPIIRMFFYHFLL